MYCKKCGTEQQNGHKFCPKCGTPYIEVEHDVVDISKDEEIDKEEPQEEIMSLDDKKLLQEQMLESGREVNGVQTLSPTEEKITRRIAKAGMWIIIVAIVLTFVRAGFGFSFWWYLLIIIFAGIALFFCGVNLPESDGKTRSLDSNDASVVKIASYLGAAILVVLYLWGPLNANYTSGSSFSSSDYNGSSFSSSDNGSDEDMEIEVKMSNIRAEIQSILPKVDALYSIHQQHMAKGYPYASSPVWGKWQDCNKRIDDLWNEYIRLAQKLSGNNDKVIEEARESKRKMDKAFVDMFGAHY